MKKIYKKLAFNDKENVYDIDYKPKSDSKYYLDDVDLYKIQFYIDSIKNDSPRTTWKQLFLSECVSLSDFLILSSLSKK